MALTRFLRSGLRPEPKHKGILLDTVLHGKPFRVYWSGGLVEDASCSPDYLSVDGRQPTYRELERGWMDLDN